MYDTAKRGMVFAVATGGLLLTGAAHAAAATPTGASEFSGGPTATQPDSGVSGTPATYDAQRVRQAAASTRHSTPLGAIKHAMAARSTATSGLLPGNSINIPTTLSVNLCGNAVSALGSATASSDCSRSGSAAAAASGAVLPRGGLLSSTTVQAPIDIPVNACGNLAAIGGAADSASGSTCTATAESALLSAGRAETSSMAQSTSVARILSGLLPSATTIQAPIYIPANVCGNGVAAGGMSSAAASCTITGQAPASTIAQNAGATQENAPAQGSAATAAGATQMSSTAPSPENTAQSAGSGQEAYPVQPGASAASLPSLPVAAGSDQPTPCPMPVAAAAAVTNTTKPSTASKTPAGAKVQPNATTATQDKPLVHPVVMWPRPEPAALTAPTGRKVRYSAAQHALPVVPADMTLAHTGTETLLPLGTAAATLAGGIGLSTLGQHRRRNKG